LPVSRFLLCKSRAVGSLISSALSASANRPAARGGDSYVCIQYTLFFGKKQSMRDTLCRILKNYKVTLHFFAPRVNLFARIRVRFRDIFAAPP
jgi:hypothetical protein